MNKKKNFISAIVFQLCSLIYGLVIPRLIVSSFGSSVNGLISSITQFLSFVSLLEGGLGAVILAELYKPIEEKNDQRIIKILNASRRLFGVIGVIYILFTLMLALVYPLFLSNEFNYGYIFSLVVILSLGTISQYMFSITSKLFLQANQKIYIVNFVSSMTLIINLALAIICIFIYPEIHVLKLATSVMFFVQPIIFSLLIDKKYKVFKNDEDNEHYKIKNRWSGFGQNLAHFINMNTDIIVVTIFLGLSEVSIYTIYLLPITALRSIIITINNSYQSVFGKYYVESKEKLKNSFSNFAMFNLWVSFAMFMTCLLLINPFVNLYTAGVTDANYYQPIFAIIMVFANLIYCVREPLRLIILAAGKFEETNFGAIAEAIINIILSLIFVHFLGLIGIAIGTIIAISYRLIYFILFLKKDVLEIGMKKYLLVCARCLAVAAVNIVLYFFIDFHIRTIGSFLLFGTIFFIAETCLSACLCLGPKFIFSFFKKSRKQTL